MSLDAALTGLFPIATVAIFLFWMWVQRHANSILLNPLLLSLLCIVPALSFFSISYDRYMEGAHWLGDLIEAAVVALGYPLFKQLRTIRQHWKALFLLNGVAVLTALSVSTLLARLAGIEHEVAKSLAMLCITTAIAMETAEKMGGPASIAALAAMIAAISGSSLGLAYLRFIRVRNPKAHGIAIGSTSHALGTATIARDSHISAAYASTSLILCAIMTAIVAPVYVPWLLAL